MADKVLLFRLEGDAAQLTQELGKAQAEFRALDQTTQKSAGAQKEAEQESRKLAKAHKDTTRETKALAASKKALQTAALGAAAAIAATAAASLKLAKDVTAARMRVIDLAEGTGFATESLSALQMVATLSGRQLDQLVPRDFGRLMVEARDQSSDAARAFRELGVEVEDGNGNLRTQDAVLNDVIRRLQGMERGAERSELQTKLLGEAGRELMAALDGSSLEDAVDQAERLGLKVGPEAVEQTKKLNDEFSKLDLAVSQAMQNMSDGFSGSLIPAISATSKAIVGLGATIGSMVGNAQEAGWKAAIPFYGMGVQIAGTVRALQDGADAVANWSDTVDAAGDDALTGNVEDLYAALGFGSQPARETTDVTRDLAAAKERAAEAARRQAEAEREAAAAARELGDIHRDLAETIRVATEDQLTEAERIRDAGDRRLLQLGEQMDALQALADKGLEVHEQMALLQQAAVEVEERTQREIDAIRDEAEKRETDRLDRISKNEEEAAKKKKKEADEWARRIKEANEAVVDATIDAIGQVARAYQGLAADGSAAYQALFLTQQAAAVAGIIVDTQRAIMAAQTVPPPVGTAMAVQAGISGAAALATVVGTTIQGMGGGGGGARSGGGGGGAAAALGGGSPLSLGVGGRTEDQQADTVRSIRDDASISNKERMQLVIAFNHDLYEATVPSSASTPGSAMYDVKKNGKRKGKGGFLRKIFRPNRK